MESSRRGLRGGKRPRKWLDRRASQGRKTGPKPAKTYLFGARAGPGLVSPSPACRGGRGGPARTPAVGYVWKAETVSRLGPRRPAGRPPLSLEVRGEPELVSGFSPLPSFEKPSRGFVQLLPARMYENRADGGQGMGTVADERRLSRPDSNEIPPAPLRSPR